MPCRLQAAFAPVLESLARGNMGAASVQHLFKRAVETALAPMLGGARSNTGAASVQHLFKREPSAATAADGMSNISWGSPESSQRSHASDADRGAGSRKGDRGTAASLGVSTAKRGCSNYKMADGTVLYCTSLVVPGGGRTRRTSPGTRCR